MRGDKQWPQCTTHCCDCGLGTITIDEWYMVNDEVWEQAWAGRRKSWHAIDGQQILCIGCLENRICRTLCRTDFIEGPSVAELTPKWLVPVIYYAPTEPDLRGVKTQAGDYVINQLSDRMNRKDLIGDVVSNWFKFATVAKPSCLRST